MIKNPRLPVFVIFVVFIAFLLSVCDLFQTSLTAYLKEETGGGTLPAGGDESGNKDDGPWVYVAASSGDDAKTGWSAGEAVKTIGRALDIWESEGSAEAKIMLLEDITWTALGGGSTAGMLVFSSSPSFPPVIEIPPGITDVILNGGGKALNQDQPYRVLRIDCPGTTITLKNITVTGGRAGSGDGGGIRLDNGALVLAEGAGISYNEAARGGGVYINSGTFTMKSGTIRENTATSEGGGVFVGNTTSEFTMQAGTVSENRANSSTGKGGGICVGPGGTFTMEGGTVKGNVSDNDGGGVYVYGNAGNTGSALIRNGYIGVSGGGNKAKYGAGIYTAGYGNLTLGNSSENDPWPYVQYNIADNTGGGAVVHDTGGAAATMNFYNGTISNNNGATLGGGILLVTGALYMNGGKVTGNSAVTGPGITVQSHSTGSSSFYMGAYARVLDTANPVYLDYSAAGPRHIELGMFAGDLTGGIAKIALSTGYSAGVDKVLYGDLTYHDKFTVISSPSYTIDSSGFLQ
ncbi:MAG: hypothetical protein LBK08_03450 [Treponema sp.]|nr:hypothetical protein [Treponema sp.]